MAGFVDWTGIANELRDAGPAVANHLWQSTVFAVMASLLALALRRNHARARYWIWMAASLKFLLPFALLMAIGSHLVKPRAVAAPVQQTMYYAAEDLSEPFAVQPMSPAASIAAPSLLRAEVVVPLAIAAAWLVGFAAVLWSWCVRWRRVAKAMRRATLVGEGREVEALRRIEHEAGLAGRGAQIALRLSEAAMEPGIFGTARPVLGWPAGISERLDDAQLEAVLAHEVCHVGRRDNLTAALHMFVEAAFWFHPLVWWIGARLVAERERACDEEVLRVCARPQAYAESILKVCEFCVESPVACVSGVTGADLKQRVAEIMTQRVVHKLTLGKKLLLLGFALCAVAVPVVLGQAKAAQRMMLAAANSAPKPMRAMALAAAHAMIPEIETPSAGLIAEMQAPGVGGDAAATADDSIGPAFEVATIRPANRDDGRRWFGMRLDASGRYTVSAIPLNGLVRWAYLETPGKGMVAADRAAPKWVTSDEFDISAKVDDAYMAGWDKLSNEQRLARVRPTLRRLLADRFHLKLRVEMRDTPVYALVQAKGGAHVKEVKQPEPVEGDPFEAQAKWMAENPGKGIPGGIVCSGDKCTANAVKISNAIGQITGSSHADRMVIDETGLTGYYDFSFTQPQPNDDSAMAEVSDDLGMKFEPRTVPVKTYVIESAEKPSVDGEEVPGRYSRYATFTGSQVSAMPVAQVQEKAARPSFEAATIKPNTSGCCTSSKHSPDQITLTNQTLKNLIVLANQVQPYQVIAPDWMENLRFDITAKYPPGTKYEDRWPMLRTLLEDRFGLKVHRETKEMTGYSLQVASGGFKLKPSEPGEGYTVGGSQGNVWTFKAYKVPMSVLAWELADSLGEVVVDKTGLTGVYDYQLRSANNGPTNPSAGDTDAPSIFTALEETLGLHLQHGKVAAEVIVVDHAERAPTEN